MNFILPEDLPKLLDARKRRLAGETTSYEIRMMRSDGESDLCTGDWSTQVA